MKYFFVDAETDGLYGPVIAVGAVVYDDGWTELGTFQGAVDLDNYIMTEEWVKQNVLPHMKQIAPRYESESELLDAFWGFWITHREGCLCIADVAYPVEMSLFKKCVLKNEQERRFQGPYPLLDLSTALYVKGIDPLIDRGALVSGEAFTRHNPLDDARLAAKCWRLVVNGML
ncbi:hypothetical protein [Syntrophothermus lipocalidus]|uniref:Uncharacterized protein n=1 Tax=Syntrophothermus lipocalidus (strain DSM 12680 / TGB-C1) TaxID=643648 RepID=D7CN29_SYNLT|nr:hypothetical protein [Syntrophothermus lipocalidus]ADI02114.1 hypothetical protein Slip_1351 [Syntrophothermus lipocalidus DSM 12680]HOV43373.1 hypothetical protein [Syntrophothermus lipocalidus]